MHVCEMPDVVIVRLIKCRVAQTAPLSRVAAGYDQFTVSCLSFDEKMQLMLLLKLEKLSHVLCPVSIS